MAFTLALEPIIAVCQEAYEPPFTDTDQLDEGSYIAYKVHLNGGFITRQKYRFYLDVPDDADFDLFLTKELPDQLDWDWLVENAIASSYQEVISLGVDEEMAVTISSEGDYWLVVTATNWEGGDNSGTYTLRAEFVGYDYNMLLGFAGGIAVILIVASLALTRARRPKPEVVERTYEEAFPQAREAAEVMICPVCGSTIPSDSVFCPECGSKIR